MKIGIIWGSDSGDTEDTTMTMEGKLTSYDLEVINVAEASVEDFRKFDLLILGISTWYDGDLQSDWEDFFPTFEKIDFTNKTVAIFGLGDQYGYDEYFIDGVGILAKEILKNGGEVIGHWSTESYEFVKSKALMNENTFYGLALDEGNQYDLSPERIDKWLLSLGLEIS
ncbi:MAG: flavodoxin [Flavobacteriales bacterium]|jgi:flavodoxin I|nr:flavodoxin [Flavobacteriales bacterium]|tara:strand:+ start:11780 stop:12286 length:507 start_codon:yes stop_codon:yes gene_type:complete